MKFKKIEISAFRIYDKSEDATFDFSIDDTTTADFVSLYAPNGYGKTSFYDAVEWGMTNNIQRFWQNKVITNGAIDALKSQSDAQVKLWRNTNSTEPTYVKITADGLDSIDRRLAKPHGNKKSDADMESVDNVVNREFRNVILSQEWISAFLREIDGTKRYEIFMDNPELKEVNGYYKNLKALLSYCQGSISGIEQEIFTENERILALENENVLDNINQQIDILIERFEQKGLARLTLATTKEEISRLRNLVVERQISINDELEIRQKLDWISAAKLGNDNFVGIRTFFELESRNKTIEESLKNSRNVLAKYSDVEKKSNEIGTISKLLENKEIEKNEASNILSQFEEYQRVSSLISQTEKKKTDLKNEIITQDSALKKLEIKEAETKSDLNNRLAEITQLSTTIAGLPERLLLLSKSEQEINGQTERIQQDRERLKPLEDQYKTVENEIKDLKDELLNISKGNYSVKLIEDLVLAASIDVILANRTALNNNEELLVSLSSRIGQQENLNSEISNFINRGLDIVNQDRSRNTCPLCEQAYQSHQELADRIANNNALGRLLQDLLADKNRLQQESARLRELIKNANDLLIRYFNGRIVDKQTLQAAVSDHITTLTEAITLAERNLEITKNNLRELKMQQLGLSNEAYEQDLKNKLDEAKKSEEDLNGILKVHAKDISGIKSQLAKLKDELKLTNETFETLSKSEPLRLVTEWFRAHFGDENISLDVLQRELTNLTDLIKDNFDKISSLKEQQQRLVLELGTYSQSSETENVRTLQEEKQLSDAKIDAYKSLLKDKLEIEPQFIDFKTLSATLDLKENGLNVELLRSKSLVDEYIKVEKYAEHINEFLQSENARLELIKLAQEKEFLEQNVTSLLINEVSKTKAFLQDKVKEFFYENLINDLYRKIDPHPDFKEVHFSADFDSDSPRLDVFVKKTTEEEILIPNLYFSTAQINILSLSIFLATALNTPGYDCIFIDDPIQSMDSVNVLSTIDLLRSLVLNYKKQIVLSTHDETFFNLLKKKMPAGPFKSKFLELESIGKVKAAV